MKNDEENPEGNAEGKPVEAAKPAKPAKPKKEKKPKSSGDIKLPFLLEFTYTVSTLILIFLALAIIITSFLAGASLYVVVLRTVIAVMVVGSLLTLISSQISSGLLFAAKLEQEETEKKLNEAPEEMPEERPLHSVFDEEQKQVEAA